MVPVPTIEPLTAENVLWANTVLAAGSAVGFVIYTGPETRAVMNTSRPETKVGLLDVEINRLAKVGASYSHMMHSKCKGPDFMCSYIRTFFRLSRFERIPRSLVYLHFPFLDSLLVHYTHQVKRCLTSWK